MNELEIFKSAEFGDIRTMIVDNEPWFVGKDLTKCLGYSNASKALADHVDTEDKLRYFLQLENTECMQWMNYLTIQK